MIYVIGICAMLWLYLYQKAPVLWPVSAGAEEPAFSQNFQRFKARIALEERLFPIANKIALALLVVGAVTMWFDYVIVARTIFAIACVGYVVLNKLPQFYPFALKERASAVQ